MKDDIINKSDEKWIELGALIDEARNLFDNENYLIAIDKYKKILKYDELDKSHRAVAVAELGYCYYEIDEYELAKKNLLLVEELDKNFLDKHYLYRILGVSYFGLEEYSKAIEYQKQAMKLSANKREEQLLSFEIGRSYLFNGDVNLAIKNLKKKYLKSLPASAIEHKIDTFYNLGFAYIYLKKNKDAQQCYQFIINNKRNNHDLVKGYYGLTKLCYKMKQFDKVKYYASEILKISENFSQMEEVKYYLIKAFQDEADTKKVTELAKEYIKEFPDGKYKTELQEII